MRNKFAAALLLPFIFGSLVFVCRAQTPGLSSDQIQAIKSIRIASGKKAAPLALRLAVVTKQIYENMLSEKENPALRHKLSREMEKVAGQLLAIKGQSIRDIVRVLTPEQRDVLRSEMRKPGAPADLSELIGRIFSVPEK